MATYDLGKVVGDDGQDANLTNSVTDGDTTHCPTGDAVYDFVMGIIGNIISDMES